MIIVDRTNDYRHLGCLELTNPLLFHDLQRLVNNHGSLALYIFASFSQVLVENLFSGATV